MGPYIPIYGAGALLVYLTLYPFRDQMALVLSGAADGVLPGDTDFWQGNMDGLVSGFVSDRGFRRLHLPAGCGLDGI